MTSPMVLLLAISLVVVLGVILAVTLLLLKRGADFRDSGQTQALLQLQQQVSDLVNRVQESTRLVSMETSSQLQSGTKALTDLVLSSQDTVTRQVTTHTQAVGEKVGSLQERLTQLDAEIRHLAEMGQDIRGLQDILRSPKVRGGFGELLLENLLGNTLSAREFTLQYPFRSGEKVDAVITLPGGLVPVDAKFPLENFQRLLSAQGEEEIRRFRRAFQDDIRRHAQAIASKYIRPAEGTLDLALMYVPAENVYYEAFVSNEEQGDLGLWQELLDRRVFPVSPNSFSLYLSTLQLGLRGLRVEEEARRIVATLAGLKGDLQVFRDSFELLSKHLTNAARNLEEARTKLERFDWKLRQVDAEPASAPAVDPGEGSAD